MYLYCPNPILVLQSVSNNQDASMLSNDNSISVTPLRRTCNNASVPKKQSLNSASQSCSDRRSVGS